MKTKMERILFSFFLIFIYVANVFSYKIANNLQPYM